MNRLRFLATRVGVWPLHPFLVAWLPVLEFYRINFGSSHLRDALGLGTAYSLVIVLIGLLLRVALGSTRRAAFAASALAFVLLRGGAWADAPAAHVGCLRGPTAKAQGKGRVGQQWPRGAFCNWLDREVAAGRLARLCSVPHPEKGFTPYVALLRGCTVDRA